MVLENVFYWLILNILNVIFLILSLYLQLLPSMKDASFIQKLGLTEIVACIELMIVIPLLKIGRTFLSPAQLSLASFSFMFIGQILADSYLLNITTSLDDYIAMILIMLGMIISLFTLIG